MRLNRKGFTLVELLGVIAILSLVAGISSFAIINSIKSSKEKALDLTLNGILSSAEVYSVEQGDAWHTSSGYEYSYYCVTIEELMNKGLIKKSAGLEKQFKDNNIDMWRYVVIKRDKVTFDILKGNARDLIDENYIYSDAYNLCSGNVNSSTLTSPSIGRPFSYTDTINVNYRDGSINNPEDDEMIKEHTCYYGENSNSLNNSSLGSGGKCDIGQLKQGKYYYVKVCMSTTKGNSSCSNTIGIKTKELLSPVIEKADVNGQIVNISFNDSSTIGEAYYYFKSNEDGKSSTPVEQCLFSGDRYSCGNSMVTSISAGHWYRNMNDSVSIEYSRGTKVRITAEIRDKSDNFNKVEKEVSIFNSFTATFHKNGALTIGGKEDETITLSCIVTNGSSCTVRVPSIEVATGYSVVGWNKNASGTTNELAPGGNLTLSSNEDYYAIIKSNDSIDADRYSCEKYGNTYRLAVLHITTCNSTICQFDKLNGLEKGNNILATWDVNNNLLEWERSSLRTDINSNCKVRLYVANISLGVDCYEGVSTSSNKEATLSKCTLYEFYRTTTKVNNRDNWYYFSNSNCYVSGEYLSSSSCSSGGGSGGTKVSCKCQPFAKSGIYFCEQDESVGVALAPRRYICSGYNDVYECYNACINNR